MAYTADDLVAIEKAIANGSSRVRYADREVQYRSLDELIRIRNMIRGEADPEIGKTLRRYGVFSSGL